MWSVAVLDQGISNWFESTYKQNQYETDLVNWDGETDYGEAKTHGTKIAMCIQGTNPALQMADIRVMTTGGFVSSYTAEAGLQRTISLVNQGYQIGAVNLSWGGDWNYSQEYFHDEIQTLAARGVYTVCASGNSGTASQFESPIYPAAWSDVIAVGAHDGRGNPTAWSQNAPGRVDILANGTDTPEPGTWGTSFAAPKVSATVATVQAIARAALGTPLSLNEMVDVLQQGGRGPQSNPDPADNRTRYFLHDHAGSLNYCYTAYLAPRGFNALNYVASYGDLMNAFGTNEKAGLDHLKASGAVEGRSVSFDGLRYIASNADLIAAFGTNGAAGAAHYIRSGRFEGRSTTAFDPSAYEQANPDVMAAFGSNLAAATQHYVLNGWREGRRTTAPAQPPEPVATSEGGTDFADNTGTAGRVSMNQGLIGSLSSYLDHDWYRITLTAGRTVTVDVRGASSGGGTVSDPKVALRNATGSLLASDDDTGTGWDAQLTYTPTASGNCFIDVSGYGAGSYTLGVASRNAGLHLPDADVPLLSGDDGIADGWFSSGKLADTFNDAGAASALTSVIPGWRDEERLLATWGAPESSLMVAAAF